jgi:hypothetical protein
MCLFLDASISQEEGNRTVKQLVDDAAHCKVNLVVYPVTIQSNYPADPDVINEGSMSSCNLVSAKIGAKASTSVCTKYPETADKMCNPAWTPKDGYNTAGCAMVQGGAIDKLKSMYPPDSPERALIDKFEKEEGRSAALGKPAPSIEDIGACTGDIVGHEAIGHSEMGMPNGKSHGKGIGLPSPGYTGDGAPPGAWTAQGCASFVESALPNPGRWKYNAARTQYYTRVAEPANQWNLLGGGQLFHPLPPLPPPGSGGIPPTGARPPPAFSYDEAAPRAPPSDPPGSAGVPSGNGGGGNPPSASADSGSPSSDPGAGSASNPPPATSPDIAHKKQSGAALSQILLAALKPSNGSGTAAPAGNPSGPPPPIDAMESRSAPVPVSPGGGATSRLLYDESAKKAPAAGRLAESSPYSPPEGNSAAAGDRKTAGTRSLIYDEGAAKGGNGSSAKALTYDESTPKNGRSGLAGSEAGAPVDDGTGAAGDTAKGGGIGALSSDFFSAYDRNLGGDDEDDEDSPPPRPKRKRPVVTARLPGPPNALKNRWLVQRPGKLDIAKGGQ